MGRIWGKLEDREEYGQNMLYEKIIIKMYETATEAVGRGLAMTHGWRSEGGGRR